jgi:CRISPR-associated protein Cmr2
MEYMSEGILIFTFSPVQSFISESRKISDLYTGSRILVELAQEVGKILENPSKNRRLVFPSDIKGDLPNKLVAILPLTDCSEAAQEARSAFYAHWNHLAEAGLTSFSSKVNLNIADNTWSQIWKRQIAEDYFWEIYWVAVPLVDSYQKSYKEAEQILGGIKRTRTFKASLEEGEKDTLSGMREALHTACLDSSRHYWEKIVQEMRYGHLIQPGGRECLDSIGLIKRFTQLREGGSQFSSTSSIACRDFLDKASKKPEALEKLELYNENLKQLGCPVSGKDVLYSFDGDFLYPEMLTEERLYEDYGIKPVQSNTLNTAISNLKKLYKAVGSRPSSYYAILMLDGDNMGVALSKCTNENEHRDFSKRLNNFSKHAKEIFPKHLAMPVYTGGDDVLALAPLSKALPLAIELAKLFNKETGESASAGIVISHHRSPLGTALRIVREAEKRAKSVPGKAAICVRVVKHGGQEVELISKWDDISSQLGQWVEYFRSEKISTRMAYDLLNEAHTLTYLETDVRSSGIRRLLNRHKTEVFSDDIDETVQKLAVWAGNLDLVNVHDTKEGFILLGNWLTFARFVANGGVE